MCIFGSFITTSCIASNSTISAKPSFNLLWSAPIINGTDAISWGADSKRFALVDENSRGNKVFDAATANEVSHWTLTSGFDTANIALMPDGKVAISTPYPAASSKSPAVVSIIDADNGQAIKRVTADESFWGDSYKAKPFALSDNGKFLATRPANILGRIIIFNTGNWSVFRQFLWDGILFNGKNMGQDIDAIAFSHDGTRVAAGSAVGAIAICSMNVGDCQVIDHGASTQITALAFTPDDKLLISATRGEIASGNPAVDPHIVERSRVHLRGWDVASGREVLSAPPDGRDIHYLSIHPSGDFFAVGHREASDVTLFSTSTFTEIGRIKTSQYSGALAFSPDGSLLAASDYTHVMIYKIHF